MRARRIENLEALQLKASEIAQITVKELEARHYLVWWLSSYDRNMKRGYNNETICLSTYQLNEFCFSYAITSEVEKFYLLIQPENWFLNDLTFESASIDEKGLVLNLAEVNDQLFKLYISRMQIRFNLDEIHAERLTRKEICKRTGLYSIQPTEKSGHECRCFYQFRKQHNHSKIIKSNGKK